MKTDVIINREALYALRELPSESVNCCVTSPPYYGLRDYGLDMQIGREDTPEQYIDRLVEGFRELRRVLKDDGTFWLNIADTYCGTGMKAGCKQKDLIGIPWLLAFALRADGWYLRSDIIWLKENPMPESCRDPLHRNVALCVIAGVKGRDDPLIFFDIFHVSSPSLQSVIIQDKIVVRIRF